MATRARFKVRCPSPKNNKVAAINWGLVAGKTQTFLPWDSWRNPYVGREPVIWFHEVFRIDGTPIYAEETELIKQITGKVKAKAARTQRPNIFRSLVTTETDESDARTNFAPAQLLMQMNVD